MKSVKVKRDDLLVIVKKNRENHRDIFLEALEGYRMKLMSLLETMIFRLKNKERVDQYIHLVQPVDQTKEYDRAIRMLEMSVDDIVELDENKFANLVQDDWSWSDQFFNTNAVYSNKAASFKK